jgi:hypothetical protein
MKILKISLFCLFFAIFTANSQSFKVTEVDDSNYPTIKAEFYVYDKDGVQVKDLDKSDFSVTENSNSREIISFSCPPPSPPVALSSVLTIDVSGSMSGNKIEMAKEAARAWVNGLPLGQSECCITSFTSNNMFVQDFTTDRGRLLSKIDALRAGGGTDFDAAFLDPLAGGILAAKNGKHKKVLIVITDGLAYGNETGILNQALANDIMVFCVTLGFTCPDILRNIAEKTGGMWFENVTTVERARAVYEEILKYTISLTPCTMEWISRPSCSLEDIDVIISYNEMSLYDSFSTY